MRVIPLLLLTACGITAADNTPPEQISDQKITPRYIEESPGDIPFSVTSLDQDSLTRNSIHTLEDLAHHIPGLVIIESGNGTPTFSFRGSSSLGSGNFARDTSPAVWIDGVPVLRANGLQFELLDIERIEVLHGPQGTLYGHNSNAGVINIITAKPDKLEGFQQQFGVGNRALKESRTYIDIPMANHVSARLNYLKREDEGSVDNRFSGPASNGSGLGSPGFPTESTLGQRDTHAYRVSLRWAPDSRTTLEYIFDRNRLDGTALPHQLLEIDNATLPNNLDNIAVARSRMGSLELNNAAAFISDLKGHNLSIELNYQAFTLKSITGYRDLDLQGPSDLDGGNLMLTLPDPPGTTPYSLFEMSNSRQDQQQWSQELQLIGTEGDREIGYLFGLHYVNERGRHDANAILANHALPQRTEIKNEASAFYGEISWQPGGKEGRFTTTLGGRYTRDKRRATILNHFIDDPAQQPTVIDQLAARDSNTWNNVDGSLSLHYRFSDTTNLFGRLATGHRSGGFNTRALNQADFFTRIEPEKTTTWELGLKSVFWNNQATLNATLFYNEFEDLQIDQTNFSPSGLESLTSNLDDTDNRGFELQANLSPYDNFQFSASYTWLDREPDQPGMATRFPLSPENSVTANLFYTFPDLSFGKLSINLFYRYSDKYAFSYIPSSAEANGLFNGVNSHDLWNGRITLQRIPLTKKGNLRLSLWGKNLLDEEYLIFGSDQLDSLGIFSGSFAPRRSYGLDISYEI